MVAVLMVTALIIAVLMHTLCVIFAPQPLALHRAQPVARVHIFCRCRRKTPGPALASKQSIEDNGRVLEMNEPQVWTLIGVFAAASFGMSTVVSTLFVRVIRSEIGGLRGELRGEIGGLRGEIGGLRGEMNARFEAVDRRFDYLDRDVQALTKHVFGRPD
jgi:hypothetical protein